MKNKQIFSTTNYEMFNFSKFNRKAEIRQDLVDIVNGTGFTVPIIVNEDYTIIDGQHRLLAAKYARKPIEYIVVTGLTENDIESVNSTQNGWVMEDYINLFARKGLEDYVLLERLWESELCKGLNIQCVVAICLDYVTAGTSTRAIRSGEFKFNNYKEAIKAIELLYKISQMLETKKLLRNITYSIYKIYRLEKFKEQRLLNIISNYDVKQDLSATFKNQNSADAFLFETYNGKTKSGSDNNLEYHFDRTGAIIIEEKLKSWVR